METFLENAFILLGIFAVCNIFLQVTKCLKYLVLTKWAGVPDSFFQSLGEWAVITGGTDGIGKAFAHEFAKCGLNIVLISRTKEKLTKVADEIEQASGREVKTIQVNFIKRDIYQHIKENLRGLEIGVLVNNVGIMQKPDPCRFLEINDIDKTIDDMINVNMVSVVKMTQLVLPKMKERVMQETPVSYKNSMVWSSITLQSRCLMPYGVASAMSQLNPGIITKLAKEYVRSSLDCTLLGERGHGCLPHEILAYVYGKLPQWITYSDVFLDKMRNYLQNRGRSYRNPQP
ncbi:17-beta-hydroxysteroid dehydrogenase type 3 isoform X4 [Rhincodon typus]|uniref:17-beta-hydroxysteroid dehydrogenase type 3 isoform X4 n=1 Tax=Rhincodon typus TaxID=259920 RepID=UPI00202E9B83|nr:17-beta-hydroxysteroid dehydrogenase type 3 isoform X4 [Rhincodon typus]